MQGYCDTECGRIALPNTQKYTKKISWNFARWNIIRYSLLKLFIYLTEPSLLYNLSSLVLVQLEKLVSDVLLKSWERALAKKIQIIFKSNIWWVPYLIQFFSWLCLYFDTNWKSRDNTDGWIINSNFSLLVRCNPSLTDVASPFRIRGDRTLLRARDEGIFFRPQQISIPANSRLLSLQRGNVPALPYESWYICRGAAILQDGITCDIEICSSEYQQPVVHQPILSLLSSSTKEDMDSECFILCLDCWLTIFQFFQDS